MDNLVFVDKNIKLWMVKIFVVELAWSTVNKNGLTYSQYNILHKSVFFGYYAQVQFWFGEGENWERNNTIQKHNNIIIINNNNADAYDCIKSNKARIISIIIIVGQLSRSIIALFLITIIIQYIIIIIITEQRRWLSFVWI